jgi:O-antigen ligase
VIPAAAAIFTARSVQKSIFSRVALAGALVPMLAAFVLTQSRGAWVSLGCSLLIMMLAMVWKERTALRVVLMLILVAAAVVSMIYFAGDIMSSRLSTLTVSEGEDVSGGRFKIWQGAIGMIRERPLTGVGIGDFDNGFYRYRPLGFNARAVYAHNDYLQMAAEMGILAPLIMIWMIAIVVITGFGKREYSPYALGCAAGVLSLSLHGLVDFNFHITANMVVFVVWAAIIAGETYVKRT